MKKVFTLLFVLIGLGFSASAQRSADLVLINTLRTQDTISFNTGATVGKIMISRFINNGPSALTVNDTLIWKSVGNGIIYRLSLPTAGMAVGDTFAIADTIVVTAAPASNPFTWCDSLYARTSGVTIPDPNIANNRVCKTVYFKQVFNTGISSVASGTPITTYPNPANNSLNIEYNFGTNNEATLIVTDLLGKSMITKDLGKNLSGSQKQSLDVSNLSNGIYMLEIRTIQGRSVTKFVVSK